MPIFMDRHDMAGATAENIAEAHRKDLEMAALATLGMLWMPLRRKWEPDCVP